MIAELVAEVGLLWHERHQAGLESRPRKRAVGAGAKHGLLVRCRPLHDHPGHRRGAALARSPRLHHRARRQAQTLAEVTDHLGASGQTGIIDGTEIRVRRPAVGCKDREEFISGKNKQNAVKAMALTAAGGRLLFCSPARPASCADITHARQLGLVKHLAGSSVAVEILVDAGYQGLGAQTGGPAVTPPHRKFKKNPPDWYEEIYERQRKAHSSRRIRVEHGIAHLKNRRALARHHGRRDHPGDTIASHGRTAFTPAARHPRRPTAALTTRLICTLRRFTANRARAR
ncbi:transposase family protein [Streptomyces sp. 3211]|uniref:transposase family protein n=1 Tax=Streptomyces sp. 3211 TaxID=1964449 RepID=UPI0017F7EBF8|nr:transposase family protein [Streptomyces sp. 3211]